MSSSSGPVFSAEQFDDAYAQLDLVLQDVDPNQEELKLPVDLLVGALHDRGITRACANAVLQELVDQKVVTERTETIPAGYSYEQAIPELHLEPETTQFLITTRARIYCFLNDRKRQQPATSQTDSYQHSSSEIDTRPAIPAPPESLIVAAMCDLPGIMEKMPNTTDPGVEPPKRGQRLVSYYGLVRHLVDKRGHVRLAAEWAIHRLQQQGMLIARCGRASVPWIISADGSQLDPSGNYKLPNLRDSLIESTHRLWEWSARQRKEDSGKPGLPISHIQTIKDKVRHRKIMLQRLREVQERLQARLDRVVRGIELFRASFQGGPPGENGKALSGRHTQITAALLNLCYAIREGMFDRGIEEILAHDGPDTSDNYRFAIHLYRLGWAGDEQRVKGFLVELLELPDRPDAFAQTQANQQGVWDAVALCFEQIIPWPNVGTVHSWHPDRIEGERLQAELKDASVLPKPAEPNEAATTSESISPTRGGDDADPGPPLAGDSGASLAEDSRNGRGYEERRPIPREEANIVVRKHSLANPNATARDFSKLGIALGTLSKLPAYIAHQVRKKRKKTADPRRPQELQLTDRMLASIGRKYEIRLDMHTEEAAWEYLRDQARPEERRVLEKKSTAEKAELIKQVIEQFEHRTDQAD
jgi:hypothetical protein